VVFYHFGAGKAPAAALFYFHIVSKLSEQGFA
jgi:hypothetical protein